MVESIKVKVVSVKAFVNMVCGDSASVTWCMLVFPLVNQARGRQVHRPSMHSFVTNPRMFHYKPGLPPCRQLDHAIDLIDESLPQPKHRQYRLS